jgi:hypothetical protein
MIVLESKPDPSGGARAYTLAVLEGVDPDALVKSGTVLADEPIYLTDHRVVGRVLSNGRSPAAFQAGGRSFPMETPVIEIYWDNADFAKTAEHAHVRLANGRILLVGDASQPTRKSAQTGWGQRLMAGETIRFA